jgi:hypothetical protein
VCTCAKGCDLTAVLPHRLVGSVATEHHQVTLKVKSVLDACEQQEEEQEGLVYGSQQSASAGSGQDLDNEGDDCISSGTDQQQQQQQQPEDGDDMEVQQQQQQQQQQPAANPKARASADMREFITAPDDTAANATGGDDVQMAAAVHSQCGTDVTEYTPVPVQHMDSMDIIRYWHWRCCSDQHHLFPSRFLEPVWLSLDMLRLQLVLPRACSP